MNGSYHRLANLSNGDPGMLEAVIDDPGLADRFEAIVSAAEVESSNPPPAVCRRAAPRRQADLVICWLVSANA